MTLLLKPKRGGFLRPFGCGEFIRDFLWGKGPFGSPKIDPAVGAPQATIFREYKMALMRSTAFDRATRLEEKKARREQRRIDPDNIEELADKYLARLPYKTIACRFHSFVVYFSDLQKLGWVEVTGIEEPSKFQGHHPPGPPRKYFRLSKAGREAGEEIKIQVVEFIMADRDSRSLRRGQRAYNLNEDSLSVYVGEGLGSLDFEEAIDLSIIKRTSLGLPADKNFIMAFVPLPERMSGTSRNSRASKNNPYVCPHCEYKATRYGNMVQHLTKIHGDYSTDPRHN